MPRYLPQRLGDTLQKVSKLLRDGKIRASIADVYSYSLLKTKPWWINRAMCNTLQQMNTVSNSTVNATENTNDHKALFMNASNAEERSRILLNTLKKKLSRVLSTLTKDFDKHRSTNSYDTNS